MANLRLEDSLAAATSDGNLLADSKFVQLPFDASIVVYAVQDGAVAGSVTLDLTMGTQIVIDGASVPTFTANLGPNRSDHMLGGGTAAAHDRVQLKLTNADPANASNYRILVDILRIR